ncbi:hypothetical protein HDA40_000758 [Hamadaea flava]|nr:hypothetical protein [Hamadaea flava]
MFLWRRSASGAGSGAGRACLRGVFEVNRPHRAARRRRGKFDPVDAGDAARALLPGDASATPKTRSGAGGQLRALLVVHRGATKPRTQAERQLRCLILEIEDRQRARLDRRRVDELATAFAALVGAAGTSLACRRRPAAGSSSTPRSGPTLLRSRRWSGRPRPDCSPGLASDPSPRPSCCPPPGTIPTGWAARPRSPPFAASAQSSSALWTIANNQLAEGATVLLIAQYLDGPTASPSSTTASSSPRAPPGSH